jgi:hypothetical protein
MSNLDKKAGLGEVFSYFIRVFKKDTSGRPQSTYLKMMHRINRISIVMFAICLIIMIVRALS